MEKSEKKSYVDAVIGQARKEWKGPAFNTQIQNLPWMVRSAVGKYNAGMDFDLLGEEFVRGGMNMIQVRSMGDNLALLTPREGENMEEVIKLNREWFDSFFVNIEPWTEARVASHKKVWVRCYGLPISLWNNSCFARVIGEAASLISIDKATLTWENLQFARLQVRIENKCNIRMAKKMRINGHLLSISIEEESPVSTAGRCNSYHHDYDSSDSISSSETYVEESVFSVKSGEEELGRRAGDDVRSIGKEIGVGKGEGGETYKSKAYFGESSTKSRVSQREGEKLCTNEEIQGQKILAEPATVSALDQACGFTNNVPCAHADLARIVVDIESFNSQREVQSGLGLRKKKEAQNEDDASNECGLGPSRKGIELVCEEENNPVGSVSVQREREQHLSQEVRDAEKDATIYNKSGKERGSGKLQMDLVRSQSAENDSICRKEASGSGVLLAGEGQLLCP